MKCFTTILAAGVWSTSTVPKAAVETQFLYNWLHHPEILLLVALMSSTNKSCLFSCPSHHTCHDCHHITRSYHFCCLDVGWGYGMQALIVGAPFVVFLIITMHTSVHKGDVVWTDIIVVQSLCHSLPPRRSIFCSENSILDWQSSILCFEAKGMLGLKFTVAKQMIHYNIHV